VCVGISGGERIGQGDRLLVLFDRNLLSRHSPVRRRPAIGTALSFPNQMSALSNFVLFVMHFELRYVALEKIAGDGAKRRVDAIYANRDGEHRPNSFPPNPRSFAPDVRPRFISGF
jgi:hypothetical protein